MTNRRDASDREWPPGRIRATRLEAAIDWAASLAPSVLPLTSSCCGMSLSQGGDPFERLGTGPGAVSARSADLLIVAGSISRKQVPMLQHVYDRMLDPRWVMAWGACAISGGAYANYATIAGLDCVLPVDILVPGCPPPPSALRHALERLRSGEARLEARSRTSEGNRNTAAGSGRDTSSAAIDWPILRVSETVGRSVVRDTESVALSATGQSLASESALEAEGSEYVDRG